MIIISILGIFVKIVLFLLLVLFLFLLLILVISFGYQIKAVLKEKANFYFHVHWVLFHLEFLLEDMNPSVKVRIFQRVIINEPLKKSSRKKPEKKAEKSDFKMPGISFFKEIMNFLKELFNVLKPKEMRAFGSYGLNDPVHTALVSFIINLFSDLVPRAQIGLKPVFDSEMLDLKIDISGRIRLIVLVYILIKYLFKRDVRKVVFQKRIKTET